MEGPLVERGQTMPMAALFLTLAALMLLAVLDYGVGVSRMQETMIAADVAAHAGVQEIILTPYGKPVPAPHAPAVATAYFEANKPEHAHLTAVQCGVQGTTPVCEVTAMTVLPGRLLPERYATVKAVAYLLNGATREGQ